MRTHCAGLGDLCPQEDPLLIMLSHHLGLHAPYQSGVLHPSIRGLHQKSLINTPPHFDLEDLPEQNEPKQRVLCGMFHIIQREFEHQNKPPASAGWQLGHNFIQISGKINIFDLTRGFFEGLDMRKMLNLIKLEKRLERLVHLQFQQIIGCLHGH